MHTTQDPASPPKNSPPLQGDHQRTAGHQLALRAYAPMVGVFLLLGYCAAGVAIWLAGQHPGWLFPTIGIVLSAVGLEIAIRVSSWQGSWAAHMLASFGAGLFLAPLLHFESLLWLRATGPSVFLGTALLTVLAAIAPGLIRAFGSFLIGLSFATILFAYLGEFTLAGITIPGPGGASTVVAFCVLAFTDRHWTRALTLPRTLDNAADAACAIYTAPLFSLLTILDHWTTSRTVR